MKPKVSVCITTYNQVNYIQECIDSILEQKTDFLFEIIIGDDGSVDGTREILQDYVQRYPYLIKVIFQKENVGPTKNYLNVHNVAIGDYVAHMDGDDYALPDKLQVLANHLDLHLDCAIVWHRMLVINEKGQSTIGMPITPISRFIKSKKLYSIDMAKYYGITGCHSGSMYRRCVKKIYESDVERLDYFFTLSFCDNNYCAMYLEDAYGAYRFYAFENTLTRSEGSFWVGDRKLNLMSQYLKTNPELAKSFAAQCFFEFFLRLYLRYPLKIQYLKMLFACKKVPSILDIILVVRIFLNNRNKQLRRAFKSS